MACQLICLGVQSFRIQTVGLLRSELFTGNGSLAVLSSQKPPARCQTLLPPSEFIWDRHGVLAVLGRHPGAGLGARAVLTGLWPTTVGHAAKQGCRGVLPFFPTSPSPTTGRLPRRAPEHPPGSLIYPVPTLCRRQRAPSSYFTGGA